MRQIMQSMVALMVLMSPAIPATATQLGGFDANDSVAVEKSAATVDARTITGTVYDAATNTPLPGVRVQGTGHKRVTAMTDAEGKYSLTVPSYVTLLSFSTPEYCLAQRPVANNDVINVRLYTENFNPVYNDEIKVNSGDEFTLGISSALTVDAEIQNKLGAQVRSITRSGAPAIGNVMFVRGINSINANTQPLVVVDGVILDLQENSEGIHLGFYNNILSAIDVNDIDKVEIMTNGTAIYGARAANGVLLITTKRGKSMATRITANIYGNIALTPKLTDMMSAEEYRSYANEMIGTISNLRTTVFPFLQNDPNVNKQSYNMYHNETDWADYVYREAYTQNYKVNVEGGDDIAMYNFSLGYTAAESPLEGNSFDRLNIRFNTDISLAEKLSTRFDISYSRMARELLDDGLRGDDESFPVSSIGFLSMIKSPFLSPYKYSQQGDITSTYDQSDSFVHNIDASVSNDNNSLYNPLTILSIGSGDNKNDQEYTHFGITVAPELTLGDFKITEIFNYSLHRMNEKYYLPCATINYYAENKGSINNFIASSFGKETQISSDTRGTWSKVFGAHSFDAMLGFRYTNYRTDGNYLSGANTGNDKALTITAELDYLTNTGDDNTWTNLAWYFNGSYNYKMRYFLNVAASMETSSRFGKNADDGIELGGVQWGLFPSVQAAWLVSSESWFNVKPINSLKLRAGYDVTGNDAIDYYAARSYLQAVKFQNKFMGLQLGNVENDGIKWETTNRFNVGFDAVLFNDRLALSFDWYKSKTSDLLLQKKAPYVMGLESGTFWSNGGEMENTGFEVALNAKLINTADLQWQVGVSAGHYKNEITALDEAMDATAVYGGEVAIQVGQPIGAFYGYETDGIYSTESEVQGMHILDGAGNEIKFHAGDVKFIDKNNSGYIDEGDKTIIGDPHPDLYGNIYTQLNYKNWQLNVGLNYSLGNDVYNYYRQQLESGSNFYNQSKAMLNRWTVEGQNTNMPRATYGDPMGNSRFSDRWIEDGSYLKLKTIQLAYKIPVSLSWLQGITVWGAAENILTITDYLGNDPEFSVSNNVLYQGVDAGLLPQSTSFHLGVKVNL